jgi:hypothetical protein
LPSVKQIDPDGKPRVGPNGKPLWNQIVETRDGGTRKRLEEAVLSALRKTHPEAFVGEP